MNYNDDGMNNISTLTRKELVNIVVTERLKARRQSHYFREWKHNLGKNEYSRMLKEQQGKCAVCCEVMKKPCVDHDHNTQRVRKLVCYKCNIRLAGIDDIEWLEKAIDYVTSFL